MERCPWCLKDEIYIKYHDTEWGVPVHDDKIHFEFLVLESAQAGLNWLTILKKRDNYRKAYDDFDPYKVSLFDEKKILELLNDKGIIRNRKKIESSIINAKAFLKIQKEYGSFDSYIWSFTEGKPIINHWKSIEEIPSKTPLSDKISNDLKKRGFKFVGSTIIYSHIQATGIVNDHITSCFRHKDLSHYYL
ncbi:MAG: DNA-3-methyladenine glycosylase [Thermoanaerobacterium sp.]|uniref:DNA-3-methyladenine glycosylase I n=1 Tax=Thermoanaerobacterium butyriciformans TaxID=1702242 RepID=A0ABS4NEQ8_9THEO|nr:DNA-3-methyladenine glycosylase I [Thermoanaerobacterium butyriciformans]MBP2072151.1 DNA-3-methyladenine glycosylase I [Thermoanaerobacterium butyriciformans]MDI3478389.1 DNA-3-methyladenine glycosylase [Thermoanaerobacterium sp.]MDN5317958.1 DNA-3-methyladenine glycosylase [Thermoanaerobacterium sp.]